MQANPERGGAVAPVILARDCGGWLAVAPDWARFSVAVTADTEIEARARFESTFRRWVALIEDTVQKNT